MIILGHIKFHLKGCVWWIIVMRLMYIIGCGIICSYKMCKNKKFLDLDVITMHLLYKKKD